MRSYSFENWGPHTKPRIQCFNLTYSDINLLEQKFCFEFAKLIVLLSSIPAPLTFSGLFWLLCLHSNAYSLLILSKLQKALNIGATFIDSTSFPIFAILSRSFLHTGRKQTLYCCSIFGNQFSIPQIFAVLNPLNKFNLYFFRYLCTYYDIWS